jgi:hypothetical protein
MIGRLSGLVRVVRTAIRWDHAIFPVAARIELSVSPHDRRSSRVATADGERLRELVVEALGEVDAGRVPLLTDLADHDRLGRVGDRRQTHPDRVAAGLPVDPRVGADETGIPPIATGSGEPVPD